MLSKFFFFLSFFSLLRSLPHLPVYILFNVERFSRMHTDLNLAGLLVIYWPKLNKWQIPGPNVDLNSEDFCS